MLSRADVLPLALSYPRSNPKGDGRNGLEEASKLRCIVYTLHERQYPCSSCMTLAETPRIWPFVEVLNQKDNPTNM